MSIRIDDKLPDFIFARATHCTIFNFSQTTIDFVSAYFFFDTKKEDFSRVGLWHIFVRTESNGISKV